MDEAEFLRELSASPDDDDLRLVFADWLEERGHPGAKMLRLQVEMKRDLADQIARQSDQRLAEIRKQLPPRWVAMIDPPVWCVAANVVGRTKHPDGRIDPGGSRLFRPGAKVYLASLCHSFAVLNPDAHSHESVEVCGQRRRSRKWIVCWLSVSKLGNLRIQRLHDPGAKVRLRHYCWGGFNLPRDSFEWEGDRSSHEAVEALIEKIHQTPYVGEFLD